MRIEPVFSNRMHGKIAVCTATETPYARINSYCTNSVFDSNGDVVRVFSVYQGPYIPIFRLCPYSYLYRRMQRGGWGREMWEWEQATAPGILNDDIIVLLS